MLRFFDQSVCLRNDFLKPAAGDDRAPTVHGDGVRDGLNGELPEEVAPGAHPLPGRDVDADRVAEVEFVYDSLDSLRCATRWMDSDNGQTVRLTGVVDQTQLRVVVAARAAPFGPEIQDHDFAAE